MRNAVTRLNDVAPAVQFHRHRCGRSSMRNDSRGMYFVKLKDKSSPISVPRVVLDAHTDYFAEQERLGFSLSRVHVVDLTEVLSSTFDILLHCSREAEFPKQLKKSNRTVCEAEEAKFHSNEINAAMETYTLAGKLKMHKVTALIHDHLKKMLSKDTCLQIWQLCLRQKNGLSQLMHQSFGHTVCNISHQLHYNKRRLQTLSAEELLTLLLSPYLCILDVAETFHLTGHYFILTMLTVIDVWEESNSTELAKSLRKKLLLPISTRDAIKAYHENYDKSEEEHFVQHYKFSALNLSLYYPKQLSQTINGVSLVCPTLKFDIQKWQLKSITLFMDIKERFFVGCIQVYKNIWTNKESSITFGNVSTRKTSPGGYLEIGPGEAITGVQIHRSYVAGNEPLCGQCCKPKKLSGVLDIRAHNGTCATHNRDMQCVPGMFTAVVSRVVFTIATFACGAKPNNSGVSRIGLKRKVALPAVQPFRLELEELAVDTDTTQIRDTYMPTVSHVFGLAMRGGDTSTYLNQMHPYAISEMVPVWAAADCKMMQRLCDLMNGRENLEFEELYGSEKSTLMISSDDTNSAKESIVCSHLTGLSNQMFLGQNVRNKIPKRSLSCNYLRQSPNWNASKKSELICH